jgi:hypothetical protein
MPDNVDRYMELFQGLSTAFGTGAGGWVKSPPTRAHYEAHLNGEGGGLGIAPLREDGTVRFAAIDLDEPDFETAGVLATLLPGNSFIEKSRSGNAHIFAFFKEPVEAWVPRGIMREATAAVNKRFVEVFPKQDRLRIGMVGNYINLPYYGDTRKVVMFHKEREPIIEVDWDLAEFLEAAYLHLNEASAWRKRANWLGIQSPEEKERDVDAKPHGTQTYLHQCAEYVIANRDNNPVVDGHRAVVYFNLAKQLAHCSQFDDEEALLMLGLVNDSSPDPISEQELRTIYSNALRGQYTSTGCDDPVFIPYADPNCPIAHPEIRTR